VDTIAAVKRARLLLEHDRESAVPVDPVGPCLMEDFAKEALRKKRKEILRRASFESWWVSCVATATGAREQGGSLVPATTHVWRLVRFVGVFAEATTIAGLAFLGNTRPWWGDTVSVVGRALALQVGISIYHIPPTDCPYETDTFFFYLSVRRAVSVRRARNWIRCGLRWSSRGRGARVRYVPSPYRRYRERAHWN